MENTLIVNSIGVGGAIFVGMVIVCFIVVYLKKRMAHDQSNQSSSDLKKIYWEEKRRYPRVAISWDATVESRRGTDDVQLKDISLGGAFVVCPQPLALKEKLKIAINVPDHGALLLNAEVVWSNANVPDDKIVNRGMGIRFVENIAEYRHRLKAAISADFEDKSFVAKKNART